MKYIVLIMFLAFSIENVEAPPPIKILVIMKTALLLIAIVATLLSFHSVGTPFMISFVVIGGFCWVILVLLLTDKNKEASKWHQK